MFGGLFWGIKRRNRGLRDAASEGNVKQLMRLLARGVDVDDADPFSGETALDLAVKGAHLNAVKTLLIGGAAASPQFRQRYPGMFVDVSFGEPPLEVEATLPLPLPVVVPESNVDLASGDDDDDEEQGARSTCCSPATTWAPIFRRHRSGHLDLGRA